MQPQYRSIRVKESTYKKLKHLAVKLDIPLIELIDRLYKTRKEDGLVSPD